MSTYFVTVTFDLRNADSEDYECADRKLADLGLSKQLQGTNGPVDLPFNTYAGTFDGNDAPSVRDWVRERVKQALKSCQVRGKLFVAVGGDWTWGTTPI
jgi:hypothetical protein